MSAVLIPRTIPFIQPVIDVYNVQLSNQPAEALAKKLVDSSKGAFALCGFASGGKNDSSAVAA